MKRKLIAGILAGIVAVGYVSYKIYEKYEENKVQVVNPASVVIAYPIDFYDKYKENYEKPITESEKNLLPKYKKELKEMKMDAYIDGYRDFTIYRDKRGPTYSSESMFKTTEKKEEKAQKKVYKDMYENGYNDGKRDLHRLPGL